MLAARERGPSYASLAMLEVDGMDLVLIENGRVKRNEVYFDRAALAPLMADALGTHAAG